MKKTPEAIQKATNLPKPKQRLPRGWTEKRIRALADHYESQTEDEAAAEDEAALRGQAMVFAPGELVSKIIALINRPSSRKAGTKPKSGRISRNGRVEERMQAIIRHYESLSEDELAAEIEASGKKKPGQTMIWVPQKLVSKVMALIAYHTEKRLP